VTAVVRRLGRFACAARRLASLAPTSAEQARFVLAAVVLVARNTVGAGRLRRPFVLAVREGTEVVRVRVSAYADLEVLREIFLDREYDLAGDISPPVILDLGSNVGLSIAFFHARYPQAVILGFEPDPEAFHILLANTRDIRAVRVLNIAVGGNDGRRRFFAARDNWVSSLLDTDPSAQPIDVECRRLDTVVAEAGLDEIGLLKLDVEGAEVEILEGSSRLDDVNAVVGEFHLDLLGENPERLRSLLPGFELEVDDSVAGRLRFKGRRRYPSRARG
jgi:FkbM family methyltransferase